MGGSLNEWCEVTNGRGLILLGSEAAAIVETFNTMIDRVVAVENSVA